MSSTHRQNIHQWSFRAVEDQARIRQQLVQTAQHTAFGQAHRFSDIKTYEDFKTHIPIQDYEQLRPYIERIKNGEHNVLWTNRPKYFAKTSGTTSGVKYIPITKESIPNHFNSARNALFCYAAETNNWQFMDGKMIFLSGSPELEEINSILTGRLSGISNHLVPNWLKSNQLPSWETNCIEDWEEKLDRIVEETWSQDMRLISGIPPWVQMYYERLLAKTGQQNIKQIFPNYSVFVYGGVNFEPYRSSLEHLVGKLIHSVEVYPASEGFIAFQDSQQHKGLLLNTNSGIFFEFIPANEIFKEHPTRLSLQAVELGVNYALIINSNAGLWGYNIGDTVAFTSLQPYRLVVTGRIKHFISAFGEHVIGKEVEEAMFTACQACPASVVEFTVAPNVTPKEGGLPYHEWFIEFEKAPEHLATFAKTLNQAMLQQNIYYDDLITGNILQPLKIKVLPKDAFRNYMKTQGKLGGQNKVPRLSNDRKIADELVRL
ncbi:MAG: GH3 auxin-responsive promoter family protein [Saprospiraceae bacterium]|nr:GH3 auxin-responsive promoter family protein [Saprospiraceae bacterium]